MVLVAKNLSTQYHVLHAIYRCGQQKPPLAFADHSFLEIPPRKKIRMRSGKARAERAVLRAWRGSESRHAIGAYERISSCHALGACESVGVLAKIGSSVF